MSLVSIGVQPQVFGEVANRLDVKYEKLHKAVESTSVGHVGRQAAMREVLVQLGHLRDLLLDLLRQSTGSDRATLLEIFHSEDALNPRRLGELEAVIAGCHALLGSSPYAADQRLDTCTKACVSVGNVLKDVGLGARLAEARRDAREKRCTPKCTLSVKCSPSKLLEEIDDAETRSEPREKARRDACEKRCAPTCTFSMRFSPSELLEEIDDAATDIEAREKTMKLFNHYDIDGSGTLEGDEYNQAVADLVQHVLFEAKVRASKFGNIKSLIPPEKLVRQMVLDNVDPDKNGAITRNEALKGFLAVVNDIEIGSDYGKRILTVSNSRGDLCEV